MSICIQKSCMRCRRSVFLAGLLAMLVDVVAAAQTPKSAASDIDDPAKPIRQMTRIEHGSVVGDTVFLCWPRSLVGRATLTAVDIKSYKVKWTYQFGIHDVTLMRLFGDQIYCSTAPEPRGQSVGAPASIAYGAPLAIDPFQDIHDFLLNAQTGEIVMQRTITPKGLGRWREPIIDNDYLITDRVFRTGDSNGYELSFIWDEALVDGDKFYTLTDEYTRTPTFDPGPERTRIVAEPLKPDSTSDQSPDPVSVPEAQTGVDQRAFHVVRRTDLKNGTVEIKVDLPEQIGDQQIYWRPIAARDDLVYLHAQYSHPITYKDYNIVCYDIVQEKILWNTVTPCELSRVRFRDAQLLVAQPRTQALSIFETEHGSYERHPLVIDVKTGQCQPDPAWRDPFSLVRWYTGLSPIVHLMKNDQYMVVLLNESTIMCIDAVTGRLIWRREASGPWAPFSDILADRLVLPCPGGAEIYDVATGESHRMWPEDIGLTMAATMRLPRQLSVERDPTLTDARSDMSTDRQLMLLPLIPLVGWVIFRVFFWLRRNRSKAVASS